MLRVEAEVEAVVEVGAGVGAGAVDADGSATGMLTGVMRMRDLVIAGLFSLSCLPSCSIIALQWRTSGRQAGAGEGAEVEDEEEAEDERVGDAEVEVDAGAAEAKARAEAAFDSGIDGGILMKSYKSEAVGAGAGGEKSVSLKLAFLGLREFFLSLSSSCDMMGLLRDCERLVAPPRARTDAPVSAHRVRSCIRASTFLSWVSSRWCRRMSSVYWSLSSRALESAVDGASRSGSISSEVMDVEDGSWAVFLSIARDL
jgi:hypothetical protein